MQKDLQTVFLLFEYLSFLFCFVYHLILLSAGITGMSYHTGFVSEVLKYQNFVEIPLPRTFYAPPHPVSEVNWKACCRILKNREISQALFQMLSWGSPFGRACIGSFIIGPSCQVPLEGSLVMVLGICSELFHSAYDWKSAVSWAHMTVSISVILYQLLVLL